MPSTSSAVSDSHPSPDASSRLSNVSRLLALREISPRTKKSSKRFWQQTSKVKTNKFVAGHQNVDARHGLISWVEADSFRNFLANYCPLLPPPRSTIAAAFSSDGKKLASTHGDHTVKVIDCQTGSCLKVLSGHRRTPWVVRFHPLNSEILASGSLDHEVRLWDAQTGVCTESFNFYRPIASIAFHAQGQVLAVASGHKLFMWHYTNRRGESFFPVSVLKTKRSLRAVHFHPHAAPLLVTAEVNDLDSPDCPLTLATTSGYPPCPPPVVVANVNYSANTDTDDKISSLPSPYIFWPTILRVGRQPLQRVSLPTGSVNWPQRAELFQQIYPNMGSQHSGLVSSAEVSSVEPSSNNLAAEVVVNNSLSVGMNLHTENVENMDRQHTDRSQHSSSAGIIGRRYAVPSDESSAYQWGSVATSLANRVYGHDFAGNAAINSASFSGNTTPIMPMRTAGDGDGQSNSFFPLSNLASWEIPFLQGWVMGQTHAGLHMPLPVNSLQRSMNHEAGTNFLSSEPYLHNERPVLTSSAMATTPAQLRDAGRDSSRHRSSSRLMVGPNTVEAAPTELPCTVKLRIWLHDIRIPCSPLDPDRCLLIIPHAVLCSEMGAHFSPCGRFLAACVACILPMLEGDHGLQSQINADATGVATSPTRHPFSSQQVIYELRIYSLEKATFGSVLASTAIRAAHCLTSIQFSPTSEHLLLAYGRRHASLRRSHIIDEKTAIHTYTIMEVYRVSDMELVSVLPSSDDEVNVACFHPIAGGGLVYGTKEGKLRIFQYDGPRGTNCIGSNSLLENMVEGQQYAVEC